jgi:hypothetical protein
MDFYSDTNHFCVTSPQLFLGFLPIVSNTVAALVAEKESRTKEGMKMMGLHSSVWWAAWWVTYLITTLVPSIVIAILGSVLGVFQYSSGFFIWITLFLFAQVLNHAFYYL